MSRLRSARTIGLAVVAAGLTAWSYWSMAPFLGERPSPDMSAEAFSAHIDARAPELLRRFDVASVSFATLTNGKTGPAQAYGFADVAAGVSATTATVYQTASMSKSIGAWSIMRLVQTGQLDLDAPITRYVDPLPIPTSGQPAEQVTIERLLRHIGGVTPGTFGARRPGALALSAEDMLAGKGEYFATPPLHPVKLEFEPGSRFIYSNPGYLLLQTAAEKQLGEPFGGWMDRVILPGFGMTESGFVWTPARQAATAKPYVTDGSVAPTLIRDDVINGSLASTPRDFTRFMAVAMGTAPLETAMLTEASRATLFAPEVYLPPNDVQGLGSDNGAMGHYVETLANGEKAIMNGGFSPGWTSQFYMIPSRQDGVVVFTNSDRGRAVIAEMVADWASWRGLPPLKMTRVYAKVGVFGPIVVSVLAFSAALMLTGLATGLMAGRRRVGPRTWVQGLSAVVALPLCVGVGFVWFGMARMIVRFAFPWIEAPISLALGLFIIATTLAVLVPARKHPIPG